MINTTIVIRNGDESIILEDNPTKGRPDIKFNLNGPSEISYDGINFDISTKFDDLNEIHEFLSPMMNVYMLYIWRNVWFYNKKGTLIGIGRNSNEALENVIDYIYGLKFANLDRKAIAEMVRAMVFNIQPEVTNTPTGFVMWQPD